MSEINDRLSPNNAPPTTMATIHGIEQPVWVEMAVAIGVRATIVPTDVPIDSEVKQAAKKIPAGRNCSGTMRKVRSTMASTAPIALVEEAKAPARTKIQIISIML